jgi:hypothetical protein
MTTAFLGLSVGAWALVLALAWSVPVASRSRGGLALIAVWAACTPLFMIPMDAHRGSPTLLGVIHELSGVIGFLCMSLGALVTSRRLAVTGRQPVGQTRLAMAVLMLVGYVSLVAAFLTGSPLAGVIQRIFLGAMLTWLLLTATYLRNLASETG